MAEDNQTNTAATLNIPEDTIKQFPKLVEMVKASHSMDNKEKQYWIDVLPIMTDDQIDNLKEILNNEKKQIEAVNEKYNKDMKSTAAKAISQFNGAEYQEKKRMRLEAEKMAESEEAGVEEDLLAALDEL